MLTNFVPTNTANKNVDIHAGLRHTKVKLEVRVNLFTGTNPDNISDVEYQKTTPVIGAVWKATQTVNLYANYGEGFETPTLFEAVFNSIRSSTN